MNERGTEIWERREEEGKSPKPGGRGERSQDKR